MSYGTVTESGAMPADTTGLLFSLTTSVNVVVVGGTNEFGSAADRVTG